MADNNLKKHYNYAEQFRRLKKAMNEQFYVEAISIEYSILEDRLESVLRHGGKWTSKDDESFVTINSKLRRVSKMAEEKKSIASRYFSPELMNGISEWKEKRNRLMHALLKQNLHTEDLFQIASEGLDLAKKMCSKSTSFKRALERTKRKGE